MHFTKLCVVLGAAATVLASPFDRLHLHKKARSTKVVTLTSIVTPVEAESPTAYSSASNTSVSVNPYGTWNVSDTTTSTTAGALLETSAEATPSSTGLSVAITTASDGMVNAVAQRPSTVTRVTTTTLTYTMGAGATTTVKTTEYEHTITEWATEYITIFLTSLQPAQVTSAAVAQAASSAAGAPAYTTIESSLYAMVTSSLAALDSSASASAYGTAAYAQPASSSSEASVGSVSTSAETSAAVTASSAVSIDTSGEAESTSIAPYGSASTTSSSSATQSSDTTFCPSLNVQTYSDESGVDYKIGCNINYDGTVTVGKSVYRRATSSSLADCLAECDATNDCVGTAFENDACTLYSSIGQPYLDSGVEFAVRLSARQSSTDTSAPSYTPSAYTNGSVAESSAVSFNQTSGAAIATGIPSPVAGTTSAPVLAPTTVTFWTTTLITVTKWGPKWGIGKPGATSVITRSVPVTTTITPSATAAPAATVEPATITVWTTTLVTVTDYAQGIPATSVVTSSIPLSTAVVTPSTSAAPVTTTPVSSFEPSTITVYTTIMFTVTRCSPDYTDCPASATAVVTKSIPVSTTVVSQSTVTSATISQGSSAAAAQSSGAQSSYSPAVNATSIASATIAASSTTGSNFTATVALASCTSTDVCPSCAGAGVSAGDQTYKIACDVSGAGQELDTTYVSKRGLSVDSFQACLEHCSLSDECVGFAFVVESSECTLFSAITGGSKMSGVQLGFVPARLAYDALRVLDDLIEEVVEGQQYSSSFVSSTTASSTIILTPYSSSSASTAAALSSPVPANGTSAVTLSSLSQSFPAKAISYHTRTTTSFTTRYTTTWTTVSGNSISESTYAGYPYTAVSVNSSSLSSTNFETSVISTSSLVPYSSYSAAAVSENATSTVASSTLSAVSAVSAVPASSSSQSAASTTSALVTYSSFYAESTASAIQSGTASTSSNTVSAISSSSTVSPSSSLATFKSSVVVSSSSSAASLTAYPVYPSSSQTASSSSSSESTTKTPVTSSAVQTSSSETTPSSSSVSSTSSEVTTTSSVAPSTTTSEASTSLSATSSSSSEVATSTSESSSSTAVFTTGSTSTVLSSTRATSTSSVASSTTTEATSSSSTTGAVATPPAPTQTGIVSGCTEYYVAQSGDYCSIVAEEYDISVDTFMAWNPAVNAPSCSNMLAGYAYCVATNGASSATTTLTSSAGTTTSEGTTTTASAGTTPTGTATTTTTTTTSAATSTSTGSATYKMYTGNGTVEAGWPSMDQWMDFESMFEANTAIMKQSCENNGWGANDSDDEIADIKSSIESVSASSGVDARFILAIVMQESNGCVRVVTTSWSHLNPGLMQTNQGTGTCNNDSIVQDPCPDSEILQMIQDGTEGTASGDGLKQCLAETAVSDVSMYYRAARIYNGGQSGYNADDLGSGCCTLCYSSDVANRLSGWYSGPSSCTL